MNIKPIVTAIAISTLCFAGTVRAEGTAEVSADCSGVTVSTSGWTSDGYIGILGAYGEPPFMVQPNGTTYFPVYVQPGDGGYQWDISVSDATGTVGNAGFVPCGAPAEPEPEAPVVDATPMQYQLAEPVAPSPEAVASWLAGTWANVALAPPW